MEYDDIINEIIAEFERELNRRLRQIERTVAGLIADRTDPDEVRIRVNAEFEIVRSWVREFVNSTDRLARAAIMTFADQTITDEDNRLADQLKTILVSGVLTEVETVKENIYELIVLGLLSGGVASLLLDGIATVIESSARRLTTDFGDRLMGFDSAFKRNRGQRLGVERWRYEGGTIATSREFCRQHDGRVYTNEEIQSIWSGSWGGKEPGDPFVVRGGYNCRHRWTPVE